MSESYHQHEPANKPITQKLKLDDFVSNYQSQDSEPDLNHNCHDKTYTDANRTNLEYSMDNGSMIELDQNYQSQAHPMHRTQHAENNYTRGRQLTGTNTFPDSIDPSQHHQCQNEVKKLNLSKQTRKKNYEENEPLEKITMDAAIAILSRNP